MGFRAWGGGGGGGGGGEEEGGGGGGEGDGGRGTGGGGRGEGEEVVFLAGVGLRFQPMTLLVEIQQDPDSG